MFFYFSFHFCFDLPQVSNCNESDSFIFLNQFLLFFIFLFIFALTFHKCQIVKKAFLSFLFFALFFKRCAGRRAALFSVGILCAFLFVFLFFSDFFGFLFGSGCWAPCCSFFRRAFCVRFCLCFLFFSGFFWVPGDHGEGGGGERVTN